MAKRGLPPLLATVLVAGALAGCHHHRDITIRLFSGADGEPVTNATVKLFDATMSQVMFPITRSDRVTRGFLDSRGDGFEATVVLAHDYDLIVTAPGYERVWRSYFPIGPAIDRGEVRVLLHPDRSGN